MYLKNAVGGFLLVLLIVLGACAQKTAPVDLATLDSGLATAIDNLCQAVASRSPKKVLKCFHSGGERLASSFAKDKGGQHPNGIVKSRMTVLSVNQIEENLAEVLVNLNIYNSYINKNIKLALNFRQIDGQWLVGGSDMVKRAKVSQR